jgi:hypothetical protein
MLPGFVMGTTDNNFRIRLRAVDKRVFVLFLSTTLCLDRVPKRSSCANGGFSFAFWSFFVEVSLAPQPFKQIQTDKQKRGRSL